MCVEEKEWSQLKREGACGTTEGGMQVEEEVGLK